MRCLNVVYLQVTAYCLRLVSSYPFPRYYSCRRRRGKCHHLFDKDLGACRIPTRIPPFSIVTNKMAFYETNSPQFFQNPIPGCGRMTRWFSIDLILVTIESLLYMRLVEFDWLTRDANQRLALELCLYGSLDLRVRF